MGPYIPWKRPFGEWGFPKMGLLPVAGWFTMENGGFLHMRMIRTPNDTYRYILLLVNGQYKCPLKILNLTQLNNP